MDSTVNKPKRLLTVRIQSARAVFWVLDEKGGYLDRAVPRLAAELGGAGGDTVHGFLGLLRHRLVAARRVLVRAERRLLKKEADVLPAVETAGRKALTNHKGVHHGRKSEQTETSFDGSNAIAPMSLGWRLSWNRMKRFTQPQ